MLRKVFLDIMPDGKLYGFPKAIPEHLITWYGGNDYGLSPEVRKWASEVEGYPKVNGKNVSFCHYIEDYRGLENED